MTKRWISVSGEGEATVAPDMAVVTMAVSAKGKDLAAIRDDVLRVVREPARGDS